MATFESWDTAKASAQSGGVTPEAMAAYVGRGLVGAAILLSRHLHSGHELPDYWRDGLVKVLEDLLGELHATRR